MTAEKPLINRVANSGIKVINLEELYPEKDIVAFDLKPFLHMELILKEKLFRASLKELDWSEYSDRIVLIHNSTEAIIPVWAYMLVSVYLENIAFDVFQGSKEEYLKQYYIKEITKVDFSDYEEQRVVIKGCSNKPVPPAAYSEVTRRLKPYAQSIMYGEPCSTVPIFKRPRKLK
ncbi:MAG: DUF2480 family protein [Saprospiraceae bacterium]|nr:DUF2480 family protein [Saprospiraceae bacterium]